MHTYTCRMYNGFQTWYEHVFTQFQENHNLVWSSSVVTSESRNSLLHWIRRLVTTQGVVTRAFVLLFFPIQPVDGIFVFLECVSSVGVDAVLGRSVTLPCDIEPTTREDRVYMVLWFRDNAGKPLYSFDVRGRPFTKALYWSDNNAFGPRAYFVTGSNPAGLTLESVQLDDQGIYRCRVDFKNSPTRNFQINLTVIVPPHQLLIFQNSGRDVSTPVVGPLTEGSDLVLTCEVRGGNPIPTVSWFVNDKLVDGILETSVQPVIVVNRLEVSRVTREHLNTTYKCQASNTKLTLPTEKTVRLELFLKPLSVRLLEKPKVLMADTEYNITCEAVGSRPQAKISWHRGKELLRRGKFKESGNETVVMSTVTFSPKPDDDGHVLKCKAENPMVSGSGLEDSLSLNVVCNADRRRQEKRNLSL
ncbi:carcinoembryonic antigen-related cell adhesion molecule 1-like [Zootermopsis nevadensis]|uniref:carcinoembryonic antigen-related cell adhesion molecule 1-like n=1 Tax=Zootermopsis nevadensis TaxID=136037 RepID=UPI000B8EE4D7|nr:carcinoembryonic antigen-related cell adhesion molecule 1-like [Zootermopsis nevadensis]